MIRELQDVCAAEWGPSARPVSMALRGGEWLFKFKNHEHDRTPSTLVLGGYRRLQLNGEHALVRPALPLPKASPPKNSVICWPCGSAPVLRQRRRPERPSSKQSFVTAGRFTSNAAEPGRAVSRTHFRGPGRTGENGIETNSVKHSFRPRRLTASRCFSPREKASANRPRFSVSSPPAPLIALSPESNRRHKEIRCICVSLSKTSGGKGGRLPPAWRFNHRGEDILGPSWPRRAWTPKSGRSGATILTNTPPLTS